MATFDITTLALPKDVGVVEELVHVSVIFNKQEAKETLQISDDAITPLWLNKKLYTKIQPVSQDEQFKSVRNTN